MKILILLISLLSLNTYANESIKLVLNSENGNAVYTIAANAVFKLPSKLQVTQGNIQNHGIAITYNIHHDDRELYEFKCSYRPESDMTFKLSTCENFFGEELGDMTELPNPMDADKFIEMKFEGEESAGIIVTAEFLAKWI